MVTFIVGFIIGFLVGGIILDFGYFAKMRCVKEEGSCLSQYIAFIRDVYLKRLFKR